MFTNKKIKHLNLIPIILISLILYKFVDKPQILLDGFDFVVSAFSYLIWAFVIAYLLNPMMVYLEKKLGIRRFLSILLIYFLFILLIVFLITIIAPILGNNILLFLKSLPSYVEETQKWISELLDKLQKNDQYNLLHYVEGNVNSVIDALYNMLDLSLNFIIKKTIGFTSTILKLIFGILISIYLLNDKEGLIRKLKKLLYALLKKETAIMILDVGRRVNSAFSRFIIGKVIDSAIICGICFVGLTLLRVPFAVLISIIVGVTNLIPYIGGIVGIVPAVIITLLISPIKAIFVLIFLILLQQFDGWILSPKIIGSQTGLTPLLIIVALMVGGAAFGILGMFIAIPLTAVIKEFASEYVNKKLKSKGIDDV